MDNDQRKRISGDNSDQSVTSSTSSTSITSTSSTNDQQQQLLLQSVQSQGTEEKRTDQIPSMGTEENVTVVRMRNRPLSQIQQQATTNGNVSEANENKKNSSLSVLQHGLEVLNEITPEDDGNEEIRRLDSQLDHLNHYMDKVEERIKAHNEKLMNTLKHQREEREKRRRSFHERIALNQQEDDDFQRQISTLLSRVDISKNRASMYDIISQMEIPKSKGQ
ncbi:hypothetical protein ACH3XW_30740 [Acanthocheilonema viteae]|uniref:Uncharacterized protein n=1 Tax=Acanthocheilonema viteae TaxID=6277 RepID=A0A498RX05_ACAVI|nr:unnamed protein product [Acanthocheilonema viteae]